MLCRWKLEVISHMRSASSQICASPAKWKNAHARKYFIRDIQKQEDLPSHSEEKQGRWPNVMITEKKILAMRPSAAAPSYTSGQGYICCILGPMFSGKTTELIRMHDRHRIAKKRCVLVKYAGDTRYDAEYVTTHQQCKAKGRTLVARQLSEIADELFDEDTEVIAIDEGQFFNDLALTCERLACQGKIVIVAALNGNYKRKPFPEVSQLISYADDMKELTAVCMSCGGDAPFTFRHTHEKQVEVIGGADLYQALCRTCYITRSIIKLAMRPSAAAPSYTSGQGYICCILGPMFSGKTTELIRMHDRHRIAKKRCVLVKYAGDTRYDAEYVTTHQQCKAKGRTLVARQLSEIADELFDEDTEVIAIDEGQFFNDLALTCERLACQGKIVIVAALNGNYKRKPFPEVSQLISYADDMKELTAVCMSCGGDAPFTFRHTHEKQVEVIGGADLYQALCRTCYITRSIIKGI